MTDQVALHTRVVIACARAAGASTEGVLNTRWRQKAHVSARRAIAHILHEHYDYSYPQITKTLYPDAYSHAGVYGSAMDYHKDEVAKSIAYLALIDLRMERRQT